MKEDNPVPPIRLPYLDGIRGLCAVYVLLFHTWQVLGSEPTNWLAWASAGPSAVTIFLVLSGFCLALPLKERRLRDGFGLFILRRCRRILPPYYAALGLSLALWVMLAPWIPEFQQRGYLAFSLPAWGDGILVSHLLLIHDLSSAWLTKINAPLWSVSVEWHIYFVYAFVLLPIWRKWGSLAVILAGAALGFALTFSWPSMWFDSRFWYIGCFAIGMVAESAARENWRGPWLLLCGAGFVLFAGLSAWAMAYGILCDQYFWQPAMDYLVSIVAASGMIGLSRSGRLAALSRSLLASSFCTWLGSFSYSLYLTHGPLIGLIEAWTASSGRGIVGRQVIVVGLGIPATLLFAWLFYLIFERPFRGRP